MKIRREAGGCSVVEGQLCGKVQRGSAGRSRARIGRWLGADASWVCKAGAASSPFPGVPGLRLAARLAPPRPPRIPRRYDYIVVPYTVPSYCTPACPSDCFRATSNLPPSFVSRLLSLSLSLPLLFESLSEELTGPSFTSRSKSLIGQGSLRLTTTSQWPPQHQQHQQPSTAP